MTLQNFVTNFIINRWNDIPESVRNFSLRNSQQRTLEFLKIHKHQQLIILGVIILYFHDVIKPYEKLIHGKMVYMFDDKHYGFHCHNLHY